MVYVNFNMHHFHLLEGVIKGLHLENITSAAPGAVASVKEEPIVKEYPLFCQTYNPEIEGGCMEEPDAGIGACAGCRRNPDTESLSLNTLVEAAAYARCSKVR